MAGYKIHKGILAIVEKLERAGFEAFLVGEALKWKSLVSIPLSFHEAGEGSLVRRRA